jgi:hypothetical protein
MKTFFEFIKFNFLLLGFDVDQRFLLRPRLSKILKVFKLFIPILIIVSSVQIIVYFFSITDDNSTLQIATSFLDVLFVPQVIIGYLTLITTRTSSVRLIQRIQEIYQNITKNELKIEDEEIVQKSYSFGLKFFMMMTGVIGLNAVIILVKIFISAVTQSEPGNVTAMYMWFPAFLEDFSLFLAVYNSIVLVLYIFCILAVPEMIFITSAYLAVSFDRLSDKVKEVIDETENRSFLDTKRKFAECIDIHSDLIKLADESNSLYGPFNLCFIISISLGFCLLGIMIMVCATKFNWNKMKFF